MAIYKWSDAIVSIWDMSAAYKWENLVRPSWKPWANTLAYLPLATDTNDHKWFPPIYNWYRNLYVSYSNNRAVFNQIDNDV